MKKHTKKLSLVRETLRTLDKPVLATVGGGASLKCLTRICPGALDVYCEDYGD